MKKEKSSVRSSYQNVCSDKSSGLGLIPLDPVNFDSEE